MALENSQKLLIAFVTLILGVVLIAVISGNAVAVTDLTGVGAESHSLTSCYVNTEPGFQVNESLSACNVTVTNVPTGWVLTEGKGIESVVVYNGTGTALTLDTDYELFATTGIVRFLNTTATQSFNANTTTMDYRYYPLTYLNIGWGRSILNLVGGFFAIALLLVSVSLFYSIAKDNGIA